MKKPPIYLARNSKKSFFGDDYVLVVEKKLIRCSLDGSWRAEDDEGNNLQIELCPKDFERVAPKSCHLKHGARPIEIGIKFERKRK